MESGLTGKHLKKLIYLVNSSSPEEREKLEQRTKSFVVQNKHKLGGNEVMRLENIWREAIGGEPPHMDLIYGGYKTNLSILAFLILLGGFIYWSSGSSQSDNTPHDNTPHDNTPHDNLKPPGTKSIKKALYLCHNPNLGRDAFNEVVIKDIFPNVEFEYYTADTHDDSQDKIFYPPNHIVDDLDESNTFSMVSDLFLSKNKNKYTLVNVTDCFMKVYKHFLNIKKKLPDFKIYRNYFNDISNVDKIDFLVRTIDRLIDLLSEDGIIIINALDQYYEGIDMSEALKKFKPKFYVDSGSFFKWILVIWKNP